MKCVLATEKLQLEISVNCATKCENLTRKRFSKKAADVCWKEYLSKVVMKPLTGQWAKETAQHLIKAGEQPDVKDN